MIDISVFSEEKSWNKKLRNKEIFFNKMSNMKGVRLPGERRHKNRLDLSPRKINSELVKKINSLIS